MAPAGELDGLVSSAQALTGLPAALVDDLTFSNRGVVARLRLATGETVVAKRHVSPDAHAAEVEAMHLLPGDTRPALIAAGDGTIVMEDLGTGPSLADLLLGTTAVRRSAPCKLAASLREGAPVRRVDLAAGLEALVGLGGDQTVAAPAGVEADVATIEDALSATTPWLAYCPGDTCADNNRVLEDGSVRLWVGFLHLRSSQATSGGRSSHAGPPRARRPRAPLFGKCGSDRRLQFFEIALHWRSNISTMVAMLADLAKAIETLEIPSGGDALSR